MGNSPDIFRQHYAALIPENMSDCVEFCDIETARHKLVAASRVAMPQI